MIRKMKANRLGMTLIALSIPFILGSLITPAWGAGSKKVTRQIGVMVQLYVAVPATSMSRSYASTSEIGLCTSRHNGGCGNI